MIFENLYIIFFGVPGQFGCTFNTLFFHTVEHVQRYSIPHCMLYIDTLSR